MTDGFWRPMHTAPQEIGARILYRNRYGEIGHAKLGTYEDDPERVWWDEKRDDEACPQFWADPLPEPNGSSQERAE